MRIKDKNILITGAAKRLGKEIALTLARAGANIILHYNKSEKEAKGVQRKIESLGVKCHLIQADFRKFELDFEENIAVFAREINACCKKVDVLVNNASIYYPTPLAKLNENDFDGFMNLHVKIPVFLAKELGLKMVRRKKGKIINLTCLSGENPFKNHLPYSISKAALISATKGLAKELAPHVEVNAVSPGPILDPPQGMSAAQRKKVVESTLLKRMGEEKDIANAVKFLIQNDYMSGEVINVDGGKAIN